MGSDTSNILEEVKKTSSNNKYNFETFSKQLDKHSSEIDTIKNSLEDNTSEIGNLSATIDDNIRKINGFSTTYDNKFTFFEGSLGNIRKDIDTNFSTFSNNLQSIDTILGNRISQLETNFGNLPSDLSQYSSIINNNTNLLNEQVARLDGIDNVLRDHTLRLTDNEVKSIIPLVIQKGAYEILNDSMYGTVDSGGNPLNATMINTNALFKKYVLGNRVVVSGIVDVQISATQNKDVIVIFKNPEISGSDVKIFIYKLNNSNNLISGKNLFVVGENGRGFRVSSEGTSNDGFKFIVTGTTI